jgi:hypothetical protein
MNSKNQLPKNIYHASLEEEAITWQKQKHVHDLWRSRYSKGEDITGLTSSRFPSCPIT